MSFKKRLKIRAGINPERMFFSYYLVQRIRCSSVYKHTKFQFVNQA